ncbi:MAG: CoA transferase, partial [Myxococcota bacterium]
DQFSRLCAAIGRPELAEDPRFTRNADRLVHRDPLISELSSVFLTRTCAEWIETLRGARVSVGPVNDIPTAFADPQAVAREMTVELGESRLIANPICMSETPVAYERPPPARGEHTDEVLRERLGLSASALAELRSNHVIE